MKSQKSARPAKAKPNTATKRLIVETIRDDFRQRGEIYQLTIRAVRRMQVDREIG